MSKDHYFQCNGTVLEAKGNGRFVVKVPELNKNINCTLAGKLKLHSIKVIEGDEVVVDVAVYDPEKGKIIYRKGSR